MSIFPNNPVINRTYNYLYKIENLLNGKIYIGVHRTECLEDGYMGSGMNIKRAIKKYGVSNFKKTNIEFFPTYIEALDREREIVNIKFINDSNTYNIREGGYGSCGWSSEMLQRLSETAKLRWQDPEYRKRMEAVFKKPERNKNISDALTGIKRENLQNKDPHKIQKTADKHRGMKRSDEAKENMSIAALNLPANIKLKRSGRGMTYIHHPETQEVKRQAVEESVPEGWIAGSGPKSSNEGYENMNKGSFFGYHPTTLQIRRFQNGEILTADWIKGRPSKRI